MNDYRLLFQKRATDYHFAMQKYPNARQNEFNNLVSRLTFFEDIRILDLPSGGGYIKQHLPNYVKVTSGDFSEGFTNDEIQLIVPENLSFHSNSFNAVLCLSGMHHLNNVTKFVEECLRVLTFDGEFVFADVKEGTNVAYFLNNFVNKYNSLGHKGYFFNENYFENNLNIQEKIVECKYCEYPFIFDSKEDMIIFFKLFFGLDKADDNIIYNGIKDILGINITNRKLEVNWGLLLFKIKKN